MTLRSDRPQHPGDLIQSMLDTRCWTQAEFAHVLDRPLQMVNEIINHKKQITRKTALEIGAALGPDAEFWLELQDAYYLWELDQNQQHRAKLRRIRSKARNFNE
jgi:HTH-type transcriptional regulator/antitoxin HigA